MEKTENMITVHAAETTPEEIKLVRDAISDLVDDNKIDRDSPLVETIDFILDTLEAGKGITIFSRLAPEEYVLTH